MDPQLLSGTLDMLILEVLSRGESYGYQIAQRVLSESRGCFALKEGSLYPALHRLERQGALRSNWVEREGERRRKFYRLTAKGRRLLGSKRDEWSRFAAGVNDLLGHPYAV